MNSILLFGMPGAHELFVFFLGVALISLVVPILAIVEIVRSRFKEQNDKLVWVIVVVFLPLVGSFLYFFIGRSNRLA